MNFPFFMLMVGPSQTGKTTWIFKFLKYFDHINENHTLKNVLFLHMAEFTNPEHFNDHSLENVTFHPVKMSLSNGESKMDEEIIQAIEKFKNKVELEDQNEFEQSGDHG